MKLMKEAKAAPNGGEIPLRRSIQSEAAKIPDARGRSVYVANRFCHAADAENFSSQLLTHDNRAMGVASDRNGLEIIRLTLQRDGDISLEWVVAKQRTDLRVVGFIGD